MLYTPLLSFSSFLGVIVVISTLLLLYPCFSVGVFYTFFLQRVPGQQSMGMDIFLRVKEGEAKRRFGFDCLPSFLLLDFCFCFFCFTSIC